MAPKVEELRAMSDEELIARHDGYAPNVSENLQYYLDELARRQTNRQMRMMLVLTVVIAAATLVLLLLAIFN